MLAPSKHDGPCTGFQRRPYTTLPKCPAVAYRRRGRVAPVGTSKGSGIWAKKREKKKLKGKTNKEKKRDDNNCLPLILMPFWFYRLYVLDMQYKFALYLQFKL